MMIDKRIFCWICLFLLCCGRNEPNSAAVPDFTTLNPINIYSLSVPEPSGLFYNSKKNCLMTISDANSTVYELDFTGRVLNSLIVQGIDLEGIALSANCDTMYLAEESNDLITKYLYNGFKITSVKVNVASVPNHGPEGVTINNLNNIVVVNEKAPRLILEYNSQGREIRRKELTNTLDLSDIYYDSADSCYWIVSDESKRLFKLSKDWELMKQWNIPVIKAEGIAVVNKNIYIVSDSEASMYVFNKPN